MTTTSTTRTEALGRVSEDGHQHAAEPRSAERNRGATRLRRPLTQRLGSWRFWIPSAVVFMVFFSAFFASSASFAVPVVEQACGQTPLDVRTFATAAEVAGFLDACGTGGREAYRNMQLADLFYPAVFGLFMASSLSMVLGRLVPGRPAIAATGVWLALAGSAFDYLENVFAWRALAAFPEPAATNGLLGVASAAKSVSFWLAGALLLAGLVGLMLRAGARSLPRARGAGSELDDAISH